jgi:FkbM family methyltransferase
MNRLQIRLLSRLLSHASPNDGEAYQLCKKFVDRFRGENNDNIAVNGELAFMERMLSKASTVFDVGANTGEWIIHALDINPNLEIHAFEPSASTYQKLLSRGFRENVHCQQKGLGSATEERSLYVFADGSGLNSLYRRSGLEDGWGLKPQDKSERVQIQTLDDYCMANGIRHIDYLKVDVEGHELAVFKGASTMLEGRRIQTVQFEYGGCNIDSGVLLKDLVGFFDSLDYSLYKLFPEGPREVKRYDQRFEDFQYQNWALILQDK